MKKNIVLLLVFNLTLLPIYYMGFGHGVASLIHRWGWGYNSPLLIINAILLFVIFTKLTINANTISVVAKSVFPIYLIHSNLNIQKIKNEIQKNIEELVKEAKLDLKKEKTKIELQTVSQEASEESGGSIEVNNSDTIYIVFLLSAIFGSLVAFAFWEIFRG